MMNNPSWDITLQWSIAPLTYSAMSSTARIFAAITLAIPTGETHMIAKTILIMT